MHLCRCCCVTVSVHVWCGANAFGEFSKSILPGARGGVREVSGYHPVGDRRATGFCVGLSCHSPGGGAGCRLCRILQRPGGCPPLLRLQDSSSPSPLLVDDPVVPPLPGRLVTRVTYPARLAPMFAVPAREGLAVGRRSATVVAPDRWPRLSAAGGFDRFVVGGVERDHKRCFGEVWLVPAPCQGP